MKSKNVGRRLLSFLGLLFIVGVCLLFTQYHSDIPVEEMKEKYTNSNSKFITIDGMDVHYRDEGTGKTFVLIHGTAASLHTWDSWTKELLEKGFRVVRMDLPAFGLTGPNKEHDYSIERYVQFVNDALNNMDVKTCYLAGNSLGGRIAWNYAADYPERVEKLILVDASGFEILNKDGSPKKPPLAFQLAQSSSLSWFVRYFTPKFLVRKSLKEVMADDNLVTDKLVTQYHDFMLREGNRDAFIARVKINYEDQTEKLKKINIPTLIQWGKHDEWVPVSCAHQFYKTLPNPKLIVYEDLGHIPMEEAPQRTVKDVLEFVSTPLVLSPEIQLNKR